LYIIKLKIKVATKLLKKSEIKGSFEEKIFLHKERLFLSINSSINKIMGSTKMRKHKKAPKAL